MAMTRGNQQDCLFPPCFAFPLFRRNHRGDGPTMLRDLLGPSEFALSRSWLNFAFASATVHLLVLIRVVRQTHFIMVISFSD